MLVKIGINLLELKINSFTFNFLSIFFLSSLEYFFDARSSFPKSSMIIDFIYLFFYKHAICYGAQISSKMLLPDVGLCSLDPCFVHQSLLVIAHLHHRKYIFLTYLPLQKFSDSNNIYLKLIIKLFIIIPQYPMIPTSYNSNGGNHDDKSL